MSQDVNYPRLVRQIREAARVTLPPEANVIVVSNGDEELLELDGKRAWHFPQTEDGAYADYHPADAAQAISHLEELRAKGADFLLFPVSAFWWLEHYGEFKQHLEHRYKVTMHREGTCLIFSLRDSENDRSEMKRSERLIPPEEMIFVGAGDYEQVGRQFLQHFVHLGGLKPDEKVLDVGCGIGRMAVPLTRYLSSEGRYEGFDTVPVGINWCRDTITQRYPNFRFRLVDIYNKKYNPRGSYRAADYQFPYESKSFDFVFLTSVFTHMLPADMENYLSEVTRVLKRGGRCLITFFLLNDESLELLSAERATFVFERDFGTYRIASEDIPEAVVGYDEGFMLDLYRKYGLTIKQPIHYGSWCGRTNFLSHQDIIVASKG